MKKAVLIYIITHICCYVGAQNVTNSPSSMFGLGELSNGEGGLYAGMGGVSMALRADNYLNTTNPASLTGLGGQKYLINIGVMGALKQYTQSNKSNNALTGNVSNLGFGFKVLPRWYMAASLSPVSSVGYNISLEQQVEGTESGTVTSLFEGEGGISKISLSNAFLLTKRLSVGVNLSYITGSITQKESQGSMIIEEVSDKQALYADFGLQYHRPLSSTRSLTIGAIYGYSQRLAQDNSLTVSSTSGNETIEESRKSVKQYLPQFMGIGGAYQTIRWIVTAEYKYMDWSRMKSNVSNIRYDNQHRIAAGMSYRIGNIYKPPTQIMLGAGYYNSYVVIKKEKIQNYYISAGMGFTTPNSTVLSFGLKYNDQPNVSISSQKERMVSLYLNITFSERSYRSKLK